MKITYMNMPEIEGFLNYIDTDLLGYTESLIIELDKITKEEENFFKKNNIIYRTNKDKIEIFILSFLNYFVEYNSDAKEGIYFEKTKGYYKYYEDSYYIDEMTEEDPNLVICKDRLKLEIIVVLGKVEIKNSKKIYNNHYKNKKNFLLVRKNWKEIEKKYPESEFVKEIFKPLKFRDVSFGKVIYKKKLLILYYMHKSYNKKLVFKNIKNARTRLRTFPYYETLLDKMDHDEKSIKIGFYKMINRASKYNELYLIDYHFNRIIIKFND